MCMNKINNQKLNSFLLGLGILAIFAFGSVAIPTQASADRGGTVTPYGVTQFNNNIPANDGYTPYVAPATTYTPPPATSTGYTNVNTAPQGQVEGASTTKTTTTTTEKSTEDSSLSANAISARSGFLPSGLLQWIFFAILILLIVILVRKILGADKKYEQTPLKHA